MSAEMVWKCLSEDLANGLAQHTLAAKYYFNSTEEDTLDSLPQMEKLRQAKLKAIQQEIGLRTEHGGKQNQLQATKISEH
ncbi:unnamed protein product [Trichobilharzia regenti]|nr:unnamed protein product [Trichobilharzia regenti]